MVLVPATMKLMGNANWWLPKWLDRLLPTLHLDGDGDGDVDGDVGALDAIGAIDAAAATPAPAPLEEVSV